jgi:predicted dehydrogenase
MHRIAVIGAGQFGQNHCRVVRQSARAELIAVVDIDPARGDLADFRELAGRVDAAIVATPTSAHAEIGCWLLEHGIDVLVEKPIAPDLESPAGL